VPSIRRNPGLSQNSKEKRTTPEAKLGGVSGAMISQNIPQHNDRFPIGKKNFQEGATATYKIKPCKAKTKNEGKQEQPAPISPNHAYYFSPQQGRNREFSPSAATLGDLERCKKGRSGVLLSRVSE